MPSTWDPYYQTPFASRSITVFVVLMYISGFLVADSPLTYAYSPYLLATKGRVVSFFLSPFIADSLIGLLFTCLMLVQVGSHAETALGTAHFVLLSGTFLILSGILFSVLVLVLGSTLFPSILLQYSLGMWPLLLGLLVVQNMTSGEEHHRLLCLPVNVPTKWYPVALLGLFTLFAGIKMDLFIMVGIAHQYVAGKLPFLTPSEERIAKLEDMMGHMAHTPGFVPRSAATGFVVPIGSGSNDGQSWSLPSLPSWGQGAPAGSAPFTGQGQTIRSATPATPTGPDPLEALIAMGFDRASAQVALRDNNGDLSRAIDSLSAPEKIERV